MQMIMARKQRGYFVIADPEEDDGSYFTLKEFRLNEALIIGVMEQARNYFARAVYPTMLEKWRD